MHTCMSAIRAGLGDEGILDQARNFGSQGCSGPPVLPFIPMMGLGFGFRVWGFMHSHGRVLLGWALYSLKEPVVEAL